MGEIITELVDKNKYDSVNNLGMSHEDKVMTQ